jgi:uncharacterized protein (TIGR02145 family)
MTGVHAQVRIGSLAAPRFGVGLDLNRDDNTAVTGLGLPRVALVDVTSTEPLTAADGFAAINGVIVYNLTSDETLGLKVGPYVAGANGWIRLLIGADATNDADIIFLNPLPATVWLGATDNPAPRTLTVTTTIDGGSGVNLQYQWYYITTVQDAQPQAISGANANTYIITNGSGDAHLQSEGQIKKYFCIVRNGSKSAVTTRVRAVYGTGVFLNDDKWLNMVGYNLGATGTELFPEAQFALNSSDDAVSGYLYQWGRATDGHQVRDTSSVSGSFLYHGVVDNLHGVPSNELDANGQIPNSYAAYGKFILRYPERTIGSNPPNITGSTYDWRNPSSAIDSWNEECDPCKAANSSWRLPTGSEWSQIYSNNTIVNTGKGLYIRPDGVNPSVFLPAAGYRYRADGALDDVGMYGGYWSSTASGTNALYLYFNGTTVYPSYSNNRSYGFSVRCVSE